MATIRQAANQLRLRPGGVDDLDDVMRIMTAAFQPCFGEAWTRSQCAGILPMAGVTLTIAEDDRGPAGFTLVRCVADEAELLLIAVDPACQRSGIGQSLLDDFIKTVRNWGATGSISKCAMAIRRLPCTRPRVSSRPAGGATIIMAPTARAYDAVTLTLGRLKRLF